MKPTIRLVRAIAAEYVRRTVRPLLVIGAVVAVILIGLGIWLVVSVSAWWWLLLAPVLLAGWLATVLAVAGMLAVRAFDSVATAEQKRAVTAYTDMLERSMENVRTPYPLILFQIVRDAVWPRQDGFVATVSRDSRSLAPEFRRLLVLFGD